jgi:hypothetical protein
MVSLTIRNIPEEILKRIRILAAKERRSMNSEMLIVIEDGLSTRISGDSGIGTPAGYPSFAGASLSAAGREKVWTELCGEWKDEKTERDVVSEIAQLRQFRLAEDKEQ